MLLGTKQIGRYKCIIIFIFKKQFLMGLYKKNKSYLLHSNNIYNSPTNKIRRKRRRLRVNICKKQKNTQIKLIRMCFEWILLDGRSKLKTWVIRVRSNWENVLSQKICKYNYKNIQYGSNFHHVYWRLLCYFCFLTCFFWRRRSLICCLRVAPSGRWLNGRCSLHNGGLTISRTAAGDSWPYCSSNGGWSHFPPEYSSVFSHDSTAAILSLVDGSASSFATINAVLESPRTVLSGSSINRRAPSVLCNSDSSWSLASNDGVFLVDMLPSRVPTSKRSIRS